MFNHLTLSRTPALMETPRLPSHLTATSPHAAFIPATMPAVRAASRCEVPGVKPADVAVRSHQPASTTALRPGRVGPGDALGAARHRASGEASPPCRPTSAGSMHRPHASRSAAAPLTSAAPVAPRGHGPYPPYRAGDAWPVAPLRQCAPRPSPPGASLADAGRRPGRARPGQSFIAPSGRPAAGAASGCGGRRSQAPPDRHVHSPLAPAPPRARPVAE